MSAISSGKGTWPRELARGLTVQRRVLVALVIRQLMTKYGRNNIGFLWIVLEPIILCAGVLLLRSFISAGQENGVSLMAILWTGYIPLTLWRHLCGQGVFALRRSASLLYHHDISLFDCCFTTILIEIAGCTLAALIVYYVLFVFGLIEPVYDIGIMLGGWFMMALLATGMMMFFAVVTEYYEAAERFVQPFQYLMIPLCGFFFMVNWFPTSIQKIVWWMPTVHAYEMIRAGLFGPSVPTYYTPWYPILVSTVTLAIMLPLVDKARDKIHFG